MALSAFSNWLKQLDFSRLLELLCYTAAILVCIILHELAHGAAALILGDDTARRAGRLSLNPLRHIDLAGLIMLAVAHIGWAKPVPVDMQKFRHPKIGMAVTALAGPVTNLLISFIALIFYLLLTFKSGISEAASWGKLFLQDTAVLSTGLAVFNFMPIPPLDGSKIVLACMPDALYRKILQHEKYGMVFLVILAVTGLGSGWISNVIETVLDCLLECAYQIVMRLLF